MSKTMYKVDSKPTFEAIEKLQNEGCFFRFHDPKRRISSKSKSWGMCWSSAEEALRMGETVLNGKSCMPQAWQLSNWTDKFSNDHVIIAFDGKDTHETGHDGEYVATYYNKRAVWSYSDFCKLFNSAYTKEDLKEITGHGHWEKTWNKYLKENGLNEISKKYELTKTPVEGGDIISDFNNLENTKVSITLYDESIELEDIEELKAYNLEVVGSYGNYYCVKCLNK